MPFVIPLSELMSIFFVTELMLVQCKENNKPFIKNTYCDFLELFAFLAPTFATLGLSAGFLVDFSGITLKRAYNRVKKSVCKTNTKTNTDYIVQTLTNK